MWSDPLDDEEASEKEYSENPSRACSVKYGLKPVKSLLEISNLAILVRAHQV